MGVGEGAGELGIAEGAGELLGCLVEIETHVSGSAEEVGGEEPAAGEGLGLGLGGEDEGGKEE